MAEIRVSISIKVVSVKYIAPATAATNKIALMTVAIVLFPVVGRLANLIVIWYMRGTSAPVSARSSK